MAALRASAESMTRDGSSEGSSTGRSRGPDTPARGPVVQGTREPGEAPRIDRHHPQQPGARSASLVGSLRSDRRVACRFPGRNQIRRIRRRPTRPPSSRPSGAFPHGDGCRTTQELPGWFFLGPVGRGLLLYPRVAARSGVRLRRVVIEQMLVASRRTVSRAEHGSWLTSLGGGSL